MEPMGRATVSRQDFSTPNCCQRVPYTLNPKPEDFHPDLRLARFLCEFFWASTRQGAGREFFDVL